MASYMVRDIDKPLWARLRERARAEGRSVKAVIESMIAAWLSGSTPTMEFYSMEWGFRAAERGWNLERTIQEYRKLSDGQS